MIWDMRILALDYLKAELDPYNTEDGETWYAKFRQTHKSQLFPYLVESAGKVSQVCIISESEPGIARISIQDVVSSGSGGCQISALPFLKPAGAQGAAIGPVLKRTWSKDKGPGPTDKILKTTLQSFERKAQEDTPWASYFQDIVDVLQSPRLMLLNGTTIDWNLKFPNMLSAVSNVLGPQSQTMFIAVRTRDNKLPGDDERYIRYLFEEVLAGERYTTAKTPGKPHGTCSLCGDNDATVYSNGLKGSGINILNADRLGAFPGLLTENAWKRFAICAACGDLLFVFKAHLLQKGSNNRHAFGMRIAGSPALVIPTFYPGMDESIRQQLWRDIQNYIRSMQTDVEHGEEDILETLKDEKGILSFSILWATVGQNLENISGSIAHVLPSRLRLLSQVNARFKGIDHPLFPNKELGDQTLPNLGLDMLQILFYRPGPHSKALNQSANIQRFKRLVAEAVYHGLAIDPNRWHAELMLTARAYWDNIINGNGDDYKGLLYESDGKREGQMSMARWIKRMNQLRWYLQQPEVGVFPMSQDLFEPTLDSLKPYFGSQSGIDNQEKAYAFLLGILYGKVLQVQGARGVNVSANALTWLKRLTLKGNDLPGLYVKVREKLLSYEVEGNAEVRKVLEEFGRLAIRLGDHIALSEVQTTYYLLLGQSVAGTVLPSRNQDK